MHRVAEEFYDVVSREKQREHKNNGTEKQEEKFLILPVSDRITLPGKQHRAGKPPKEVHDDKIPIPHMGNPQQLAQRVLWKSGDEKEDEGKMKTLVHYEMVEPIHVFLLYSSLHQFHAKYP